MFESLMSKKRQKTENDEIHHELPAVLVEKPAEHESDDVGDIDDADLAEYI